MRMIDPGYLTYCEVLRRQQSTGIGKGKREELDAVCNVCGLRQRLDPDEMGCSLRCGDEFCDCAVWEPSECEGVLIVQRTVYEP